MILYNTFNWYAFFYIILELAETKSKEKDIDKCLRWREGRVKKDEMVDESVQKAYEECVSIISI